MSLGCGPSNAGVLPRGTECSPGSGGGVGSGCHSGVVPGPAAGSAPPSGQETLAALCYIMVSKSPSPSLIKIQIECRNHV